MDVVLIAVPVGVMLALVGILGWWIRNGRGRRGGS